MFRQLFLKNSITKKVKKNPSIFFVGYICSVSGISLYSMNNAIINKTNIEYYESIVFIA